MMSDPWEDLQRLIVSIPQVPAAPPELQAALDLIPEQLKVTVLYIHSQQHGDAVTALPAMHLDDVIPKDVLARAERLKSIVVRHGGWISTIDGKHYGGVIDVADVLQVWM